MGNENTFITKTPEAQVILDAGKLIGAVGATPINEGSRRYAVVPAGCTIQDVTALLPKAFQPAPLRKTGVVTMASIEAFGAYVVAHKTDGMNSSPIFVDVTDRGAQFTCILNHHGSLPGLSDHRVTYLAEHSVEWKRWMAKDRQALGQVPFVEHLEECGNLIVSPLGTDLMALISDLTGRADASFVGKIDLSTGTMKCNYEETVEVGQQSQPQSGKLEIPKSLSLAIVPFKNSPKVDGKIQPYSLWARLKLRVNNRKLSFTYETVDTHLVVDDAVSGLIAAVQSATGITPFAGSPTIQ